MGLEARGCSELLGANWAFQRHGEELIDAGANLVLVAFMRHQRALATKALQA